MKILMAPVNIANQPLTVVKELRRQGVDANLIQYWHGMGHPFGYDVDQYVDMRGRNWREGQLSFLSQVLADGYDIYHFWNRSLFCSYPYRDMMGFDIPFIKLRNRRIVYRFTGFDLRDPVTDYQRNPFSPFKYGVDPRFDQQKKARYIEFLKEYVDTFIVQDPEMQEFFPEAAIIPRALNLEDWHFADNEDNQEVPLIVHAPSNKGAKGSKYVLKALDELRTEGLKFRVKLLTDCEHQEAVSWYKKADIIVDQLLIGWYGVLALEGMALGKPVVCYILDHLFNQDPQIPVANANPNNIKSVIRMLVKDRDMRIELGMKGRRYVEDVHDVRKVAVSLKHLYIKTLRNEIKYPVGNSDIEYFSMQLTMDDQKPLWKRLGRTAYDHFANNYRKTEWGKRIVEKRHRRGRFSKIWDRVVHLLN
jgi:hypothetical protein